MAGIINKTPEEQTKILFNVTMISVVVFSALAYFFVIKGEL